MKKTIVNIPLLFLAGFLFSCTTSKDPVVGTWECSRIVPLIESPEMSNTPPVLMDDAKVKFDEKGIIPSSDPQLQRLLTTYPDISKTLKLKANKTVVLTSKNNRVIGTWELNQEGKSLDITIRKTNKLIRYKFSDPGMESLFITEKFKYGEFKSHYRKTK